MYCSVAYHKPSGAKPPHSDPQNSLFYLLTKRVIERVIGRLIELFFKFQNYVLLYLLRKEEKSPPKKKKAQRKDR